jgi:hypothetical protein
MKNSKFLIIFLGVFLLIGNAWGYPLFSVGNIIDYDDGPGTWFGLGADGYSLNGGSFWIYKTGTSDKVQTFCIERDEYLYDGSLIKDISQKVISGGVDSNASPLLSTQAAYLFYMWTTQEINKLSEDYASAYQALIWYYEGELIKLNGYAYLNDSAEAIANNLKGIVDSMTLSGYYGVSVLNLENSSGTQRQSLLYYNPVPEPVSMLLFGTGLVGVGGYVRRRFKK